MSQVGRALRAEVETLRLPKHSACAMIQDQIQCITNPWRACCHCTFIWVAMSLAQALQKRKAISGSSQGASNGLKRSKASVNGDENQGSLQGRSLPPQNPESGDGQVDAPLEREPRAYEELVGLLCTRSNLLDGARTGHNGKVGALSRLAGARVHARPPRPPLPPATRWIRSCAQLSVQDCDRTGRPLLPSPASACTHKAGPRHPTGHRPSLRRRQARRC